jgi:hypothetical protein
MCKLVFLFFLSLLCDFAHSQQPIALVGATLIDGTERKPIENSVIILHGTTITHVGTKDDVIIPQSAKVIDVSGKYIIPGLIDCHIHYEQPRDLVQLLAWGVTSVNCMFESTDFALEMEKKTADDSIHSPQIYATAPIFTCEGGWWYGEGFPIDSTVNRFPQTPDEAREQVRKVKAKGIKRIKLMYDDMGWCRDPLPRFNKMKKEILEAFLDEAGKQDLCVVVHAPQLKDAMDVFNATPYRVKWHGDFGFPETRFAALAHGVLDDTLSWETAKMTVRPKGIMYVPTFCVFEFLADVEGFMTNALGDERFAGALPEETVRLYKQ